MGTLSLQSDQVLPQGYLKIDGVTAATLTTAGISGVLYKPATATNGQVLTYNGSTWVAQNITIPTDTTHTTVGNARAGVFASAVCFTSSNPGNGLWLAPAACTSARVTVVGGGSAGAWNGYNFGNNDQTTRIPGGRSHFNYPSGSVTSLNQLFANGGTATNMGGNAGWNGLNTLAMSISPGVDNYNNPLRAIAGGGVGAGGVGGAGGSASKYDNGPSFGRGRNYLYSTVADAYGGQSGGPSYSLTSYHGGGSGGVNGPALGPSGGGGPQLSSAAYSLSQTQNILNTVGDGARASGTSNRAGQPHGSGGGWCSAIVSVVPGQIYAYGVGAGAVSPDPSYPWYPTINVGSSGMVLIEW